MDQAGLFPTHLRGDKKRQQPEKKNLFLELLGTRSKNSLEPSGVR